MKRRRPRRFVPARPRADRVAAILGAALLLAGTAANVAAAEPLGVTIGYQTNVTPAVWDPALTRIKATGTVLATSADVARWGAPTFDVWPVRESVASAHPAFMAKFAQVTSEYDLAYRLHPESFLATSTHAASIPGFLRGQGRISAVLPSYAPKVTADFVEQVAAPR